jgi:two-component system sensor histidine kinase/response regulator
MMTAFSPAFCRVLPITTFEAFVTLWYQLAEPMGNRAVLLTNDHLRTDLNQTDSPQNAKPARPLERFCGLFTAYGNALIQAQNFSSTHCQVFLALTDEAIADFLAQRNLGTIPKFDYRATPKKRTEFQNHLTIGLLTILSSESQDVAEKENKSNPPLVSSLSPPESGQLFFSQDQLLSQVIAQIRQSLDLSVILETAVTEVRKCLQVDRLVIYQFTETQLSLTNEHSLPLLAGGKITYEAKNSADISSTLSLMTENDCFYEVLNYQQKYLDGQVVAIPDVETAYSSSYCLTNLLKKYQIRATLTAPIIVNGYLWGLLIAHQCHYPRAWLEQEQNFLGQIGEHLAIAIKQAQLYAEVQHQKQNFENRVIERTQELRDTLLAAQAASHLKSEFLDNISHELRTPLTCVIGLSGTLLHWFNQGTSLPVDKQQHYLKMIQDSGKKLMDLINDIIELSQIESGKSALNFDIFSLMSLAQAALYRLENLAKAKNIQLKLDFQIHAEQDAFCADPDRIQQILTHLLSNAIKFTPDGGRVTLRIWKEKKQAVFQVEDTGIGIDRHQFPYLFEAFKQLHENRQRTYESTGIGLALTKQLVELHSGTVEVESTKGKGSVFTIFIPYQNQSYIKRPKDLRSQELAPAMNVSVVVIEQDEEIATLICELLTVANYQVIWLIDTNNAVKQIELLQPGIVLIDQDFQEVAKISRLLKASHQINVNSLKVILLSENISSSEWKELSQSGIDDYILKPLQPDLLLQRLNNISRNSSSKKMETNAQFFLPE